ATAGTGAAGGANTIASTFYGPTSNSDRGNGRSRLNNATENAATATYTDLLDSPGSTWTAVLDTLDASTSTVKGQLRLSNANDATDRKSVDQGNSAAHPGGRNSTEKNTGPDSAPQ